MGIAMLLTVACGSDSPASDTSFQDASNGPVIARPDDTFTIDSVINAGWKKSKKLSADSLQGTDNVWYGFFDQKDIEIRFYASHEDALKYGLEPATTRS